MKQNKKQLRKKHMKTMSVLLVCSCLLVFSSCKKDKSMAPSYKSATETAVKNDSLNNGPYGTVSRWKSIGGDTLFTEDLTLSLFYTESHSPCDICYYQLNYSLWNDYDYTFSASKCLIPGDTLLMKDLATNRTALFKRVK
jgi:hypothetical protein